MNSFTGLLITTMTAVSVLFPGGSAGAQEEMPLWSNGAPGAQGNNQGDVPTLKAYLPPQDRATGAAVVVCPGGGYGGLAYDYEGEEVAQWLAKDGVAGFVLRYRHAPKYQHPVPLQDAQRALRTVRTRAQEWGVDPGRIGILGFSAGGHLAATAGTQFDGGNASAADSVDRASSRPDFLILIYPVISMEEPYGHIGSRKNLLGENAAPELIRKMCAEKNVTKDTPPAFLVHATTDTVVPSENSVLFYLALRAAKVPGELHVYENGPHGFGLGKNDPVLTTWPNLCIAWFRTRGIIK